jgi:hypothetical protein
MASSVRYITNEQGERIGVLLDLDDYRAEGARVLSGPAPQPLTSVALEEQGGELFVTGVYGGLVYDRFFERFGFRLELDYGEKARELVSGTAWVRTTQEFTQQRIQC